MKSSCIPKTGFVITLVCFLNTVAIVTGASAIDYHIDATGGVRCDWCHDTHSFLYGLLKDVDAETVCLSCHEPGVNADAPDATIHRTATCVDCHDTHSNRLNYLGTTNTSLVGISYDANGNPQGDYVARVIDSSDGTFYNVDFTGANPKFVRMGNRDGVPGARRICQVCHDAPPSGNPHTMNATEDNCTSCHKHINGFKAGGPAVP
ncbi:MAG: hypothetical protein K9K37_06085 [Desulfocapsa sp.]|nr:hypothetical protein [Desulfocapsa sp.]